MWPFYKLNNEIVTVSLHADNLVIAWITRTKNNAHLLKAYQRITFNNSAYINGMIFNSSFIGSKISTFLRSHSLENSFIAFSVVGSYITEFVLDMPSGSPHYNDFPLQKLNRLMWDYRYLYPKDNAHHTMYICGISRQLLAQYQVLAIRYNLNMIVLTTEFMSHLHVYKHLYGSAFRRAQLARDLQDNHHQLLNVLRTQTLTRMITINPNIALNIETESPWLFNALGLFLLGRNT